MTGEIVATSEYAVTLEAIVRYAGASGDFTSIHYDGAELSAAGYDDFFAMGMLVAGRLGALVATTYGDNAIREFEVRFLSPSWVPRTLTCAIFDAVSGDDGNTVVHLSATDDEGVAVARGRATVTSPDR